jgi:predicted O-methyltransferase YrrM
MTQRRPRRLRRRLRRALEAVPPARFSYRLGLLIRHPGMVAAAPRGSARYLLHSRELTNFTYELRNEAELATLVAGALGARPNEAAGYLDELRADSELIESLNSALRSNRRRDDVALLGKRRALYAMVRTARPKVVVEAGINDGLSTAVLLRALQRNEAQGYAGKLLSFDIDPASGWLVGEQLRRGRYQQHIGDIVELLPVALRDLEVDMFVHDTLKAPEHERFELELAAEHGAERLILYTDDDSVTGVLRAICADRGGRSSFLQEQPDRHFWRGNLLGFCTLER